MAAEVEVRFYGHSDGAGLYRCGRAGPSAGSEELSCGRVPFLLPCLIFFRWIGFSLRICTFQEKRLGVTLRWPGDAEEYFELPSALFMAQNSTAISVHRLG